MVKSVSWPIPVITGIGDARMARASCSSLKLHRSSMPPPPRAMISTSHSLRRPARSTAATSAAALHAGRIDDDRDRRIAPPQRAQDVSQRGRAQRGDHADLPRVLGQRALVGGVEQPFGLQFVAQSQKRLEQRAAACLPHGLDVQLELATRLVERDRGAHVRLLTVARHPLQILITMAEHHATHLCFGVLEYEVPMAGAGKRDVRNFSGYPQQPIAVLEQILDAAYQRRDRDRRSVGFDRMSARETLIGRCIQRFGAIAHRVVGVRAVQIRRRALHLSTVIGLLVIYM
jgi:hypothetical protein